MNLRQWMLNRKPRMQDIVYYIIRLKVKRKRLMGEREYNKLYRDMENEYNDVKMRYENEQMQHKNTQKVLADTVTKVKESIKSINKRAQDRDLIIQRLQNRLKMY
eukprot:579217_1